MSTIQEMLELVLFFGGFIISFAYLSRVIENKWPSTSKVKFGNFGLVPQKTGLFFFVWLIAYIGMFVLIINILQL